MKDRSVFIFAALESIGLINAYTDGFQREDFLADRKTQDAVIRNLEIIGQALKDFGIEPLCDKNPEIPWVQIAGMRNVLVVDQRKSDFISVQRVEDLVIGGVSLVFFESVGRNWC